LPGRSLPASYWFCSNLLHALSALSGHFVVFNPKTGRHTFCYWTNEEKGGAPVLYYALVFLVVGLIAGVLGATGVAAIASQIAWILFIVGIILLVIHLATGRRGPVI
jgi:uncharacterized membrane protein YtjA (UPF0391 family)